MATGRGSDCCQTAQGIRPAVTILRDLRDLAARSGATESFARRVRELQDRNRRKETFIRGLDNAGLFK